MAKRQEKGSIWENHLGRNANQPKIDQENHPIYEVTWTNRPI